MRIGHHYHAAISFHNAMTFSLLVGDYKNALQFGDKAIDAFKSGGGSRSEYPSTLMGMAATLFETGAAGRAIDWLMWLARPKERTPTLTAMPRTSMQWLATRLPLPSHLTAQLKHYRRVKVILAGDIQWQTRLLTSRSRLAIPVTLFQSCRLRPRQVVPDPDVDTS